MTLLDEARAKGLEVSDEEMVTIPRWFIKALTRQELGWILDLGALPDAALRMIVMLGPKPSQRAIKAAMKKARGPAPRPSPSPRPKPDRA